LFSKRCIKKGAEVTVDPLGVFRAEIDLIDDELVGLLARRFAVAAQVASYKKGAGIEVRLNDRIVAVLENVSALANQKGADANAIRAIYETIIETTCRFEEAKLAGKD
jgi:chorismate mutase